MDEAVRVKHRRVTPSVQPPRLAFAGFRFPPEVILIAARRYLRYGTCLPVSGLYSSTVDEPSMWSVVLEETSSLCSSRKPMSSVPWKSRSAFAVTSLPQSKFP